MSSNRFSLQCDLAGANPNRTPFRMQKYHPFPGHLLKPFGLLPECARQPRVPTAGQCFKPGLAENTKS